MAVQKAAAKVDESAETMVAPMVGPSVAQTVAWTAVQLADKKVAL